MLFQEGCIMKSPILPILDPIDNNGFEDTAQPTNKTDRRVSIRPCKKIYKYCGQDSIRLIFRRIGPTERLYSKGRTDQFSSAIYRTGITNTQDKHPWE